MLSILNMIEEGNLIFILPFIFLILKLLLNYINNNNEETLTNDIDDTSTDDTSTDDTSTDDTSTDDTSTDDTSTDDINNTSTDDISDTSTDDTLTNNNEESETDDGESEIDNTEESEIDNTEESEIDNTETNNIKESEEDGNNKLIDYTKSNIIKLKINNEKINIELKKSLILKYIYENEINNGFMIIKNTIFTDIETFEKKNKGYYYLKNIGISVRFKNSNKSVNEIINQCKKNNIKLYMKIELKDGKIKKINI